MRPGSSSAQKIGALDCGLNYINSLTAAAVNTKTRAGRLLLFVAPSPPRCRRRRQLVSRGGTNHFIIVDAHRQQQHTWETQKNRGKNY
jgi:hypothetical protein